MTATKKLFTDYEEVTANQYTDQVPVLQTDNKKTTLQKIYNLFSSSLNLPEVNNLVFVNSLSDLPAAVSGVITLSANTAYYYTTEIDHNGNRLVSAQNTAILGSSSEISILKSTGLNAATPFLTITQTTTIRNVRFESLGTALDINAGGTGAYDWVGVNFLNCTNIGTVKNFDNFIFQTGALVNSSNLIFDGTFNTVGIESSLFTGSSGDLIKVNPTAIIVRRFRLIYSVVTPTGAAVGINFSTSATVGDERYILDNVNFIDNPNNLVGVIDDGDNKTLFRNCTNIENTYAQATVYFNDNAEPTNITGKDDPVKIDIESSLGIYSSKFVNERSSGKYVGALKRRFMVTSLLSVTSTSPNDQVSFYIAVNDSLLNSSRSKITTNSSNRAENVGCQDIVLLNNGDIVSVYAENNTDSSDVTITDFNMIIHEV